MTAEVEIAQMLRSTPPQITPEQAVALAQDLYGISGTVTRLPSERDANFRIRPAQGCAYLLKITNEHEPLAHTDFQIAALVHIARDAPDLPVPRHIRTLDGRDHVAFGNKGRIRMLTYLEGDLLYTSGRSGALRRAVGAAAGRLAAALSRLSAQPPDHKLLWDIRHASDLAGMTDAIADTGLRADISRRIDDFRDRLLPALSQCRWQAVHGDLNPHNILVSPDGQGVAGILDFGDMVHTPLVCDAAITASYLVDYTDPLATAAEFVAAWQAECPLTTAEIALLPDLIATRLITIVTVANWRAQRYPDNADYILRNVGHAVAGLQALAALPQGALHHRLVEVTS